MKIYLFYIGKPRDPHANALANDYLSRIAHYARVESREVRPDKFDLFGKYAPVKKILLDPGGRTLDSPSFAKLIAENEIAAQDVVFVVGGADGLPPEWKLRADLLVSLSAMTFPHELARAMLAEQIYRGFTILRGHPYPR